MFTARLGLDTVFLRAGGSLELDRLGRVEDQGPAENPAPSRSLVLPAFAEMTLI